MLASPWFVVAATTGVFCSLASLTVTAAGWRRRTAEVAILGSSLLVLSLMMTAHSLTNLDHDGANTAGVMVALLALPTAAFAAIPLLSPNTTLGRRLASRWKPWIVANVTFASALAIGLRGSTVVPSFFASIALPTLGSAAAVFLIRRQLFLYRIGGRRSALLTASAIAGLAVSALIGSQATPGSSSSWIMLILENIAVLTAGGALIFGFRTGRNVADILAPILSREPLAALEIGLSPEVHGFVAALERKDQITRDHVVRTSALALRVALRSGLTTEQARSVALGALLHDIGKLMIPSEIINKPSALTDEEFAKIKSHPEQGVRLLEQAPSLVGALPSIRWHHERIDGRGYPDGLSADQVTLEVSIVSVCDAWDAMTHTRQYREGMDQQRAIDILNKGVGTQWRADAVAYLLAEIAVNGTPDVAEAGSFGEGSCCDSIDPELFLKSQLVYIVPGAKYPPPVRAHERLNA